MEKLIYLDNAATTQTAPEVVEAMLPYFTENYGNPSSVYSFASKNKDAVTEQREIIARALGAQTNEIYFTAGGSESDNWALKATAEAYEAKGKHIITTKIEHHAILHTGEYLEKRGFEVTYLDVDEKGRVRPEDVEAAIRPDTILISVMFANNEIGTIEPIKEIGQIARRHGVLFHTDAVQAFGQIPTQGFPVQPRQARLCRMAALGGKDHLFPVAAAGKPAADGSLAGSVSAGDPTAVYPGGIHADGRAAAFSPLAEGIQAGKGGFLRHGGAHGLGSQSDGSHLNRPAAGFHFQYSHATPSF